MDSNSSTAGGAPGSDTLEAFLRQMADGALDLSTLSNDLPALPPAGAEGVAPTPVPTTAGSASAPTTQSPSPASATSAGVPGIPGIPGIPGMPDPGFSPPGVSVPTSPWIWDSPGGVLSPTGSSGSGMPATGTSTASATSPASPSTFLPGIQVLAVLGGGILGGSRFGLPGAGAGVALTAGIINLVRYFGMRGGQSLVRDPEKQATVIAAAADFAIGGALLWHLYTKHDDYRRNPSRNRNRRRGQ